MWSSLLTLSGCVLFVLGAPNFPDHEVPHHSSSENEAGLFEGDIELDGLNPFDRNAVKDHRKVWPHGIVPYTISSHFKTGSRETIVNAMKEIETDTMVNGKTCIKFVPRTHEHDYTEVVSGHGCHSPIGHKGGHQTCTISDGCHRKGIIMHELLHTLGFWHEQSTPNRDQYVTIEWANVKKGEEHNFKVHPSSEATDFGTPYDYNSIMHYNAYEFSKSDNQPTIIPKQQGVYIGQRIKLSTWDIKKIQILYGCIPPDSTYQPPTVAAPRVYSDSCTFQADMCDWTNIGNDDTNWARRKGKTPSGRTGPNYDHTLSYEGYYVYLEATHHQHDDAVLASKQYAKGSYCLTFYYHMLGRDEGSLKVRAATGTHTTVLDTITGDHGDLWRKMEVYHQSSEPFQFQFEGVVGNDYQSDIAIDDIAVHTGNCPGAVVG